MHLRFWKPALILALSFLSLGAIQLRAASPTITSLSVTSGAVGASVTITGTNSQMVTIRGGYFSS